MTVKPEKCVTEHKKTSRQKKKREKLAGRFYGLPRKSLKMS